MMSSISRTRDILEAGPNEGVEEAAQRQMDSNRYLREMKSMVQDELDQEMEENVTLSIEVEHLRDVFDAAVDLLEKNGWDIQCGSASAANAANKLGIAIDAYKRYQRIA